MTKRAWGPAAYSCFVFYVSDNVREIRQHYPLTTQVQTKLQTHADWALYREKTLSGLVDHLHAKKALSSRFQAANMSA